jgi:Uma2 family endonuclease
VIEFLSTNWRDHYYLKYADYEEMGIHEYWIVDHAALGGRNYIGNPKQLTYLFVTCLMENIKLLSFEIMNALSPKLFLN